MKVGSKLLVALTALSFAGSANAATILLDFEGSSQSANPGSTAISIGEFYNGGTDSGGTSGPNVGVSFTNANFDSTSQFTQPSFNINSSIAFMLQSPLTLSSQIAFNSIAFDRFFFEPSNVVNVFSGVNGTGTLLATATFGQNCTPACTANRESLTFANARSVQFSPNANGTGIDNVVLNAVPEPATWAMMLVGFGMVGHSMRRRKASYSRVQAI
jgi:hypothetical protein